MLTIAHPATRRAIEEAGCLTPRAANERYGSVLVNSQQDCQEQPHVPRLHPNMSVLDRTRGRFICVGECMVELARGTDGRFALSYGGDTFNTAVYLARAGCAVGYATALGDDPYSAGILEITAKEGINADLIAILPGRMPGLYLIETDRRGERSFWYWRDRAPARELFDGAHARAVADALGQASMVYFSGVTLSLYSDSALDRFDAALRAAKARETRIAMDSNFRLRGWGGDKSRARAIFRRFWALSDIALPTFDDEQALWADATPADAVARLKALDVAEVVIKNGSAGAVVDCDGTQALVACPQPVEPLDTTAAGDAFNAGYLAARLNGLAAPEAAVAGHRLAAVVIQHRGAIVPPEATATVLRA
jgi:2-dehydro-3-deoxygluconokinase